MARINVNLTQPPIPPYKAVDSREDFVFKAENYRDFLRNTHWSQYSTFATEANALADEVNQKAYEAATSAQTATTKAQEASDSADSATASANNHGAWSGLDITILPSYPIFPIGESVNHNGNIWVSNIVIPDVTLSEPTLSNVDWTRTDGLNNPVITGSIKEQLNLTPTDSVESSNGTVIKRSLSANVILADGLAEMTTCSYLFIPNGFTITFPTPIIWLSDIPTLGSINKIFFEKIDGDLYATASGGVE